MRHGKKIHKLNRPAEHRKAVLNNLAMALITRKQIQTTAAKAKALKPHIDRLISTALQDTLSARRRVAQHLHNKEAFKELFNNIVPKLEGRTSGFSRIVKFRSRRGDGAPMSIVQLLLEEEPEKKGRKKGKKKAAAKPAAAQKAKEEKETKPEKPEEPEPEDIEAEEEKTPAEKGEAQAAVAEETVTGAAEEGAEEEPEPEPKEEKPEEEKPKADKSKKKKE